jgi:hypothetical protein
MDLNECYKILEIEADATATQVKEAFRDLMQIYHPDHLYSFNPRIREKGKRKAAQINQAREKILSYLKSKPDKVGKAPDCESRCNVEPKREKAESHTYRYRFPCDPTELSPIDLITYDLFEIKKWKIYTHRPEKFFGVGNLVWRMIFIETWKALLPIVQQDYSGRSQGQKKK